MKVQPAKPEIGAQVKETVEQTPNGVKLGLPLGSLGGWNSKAAMAQLSFGNPAQVAPGVDFFPLICSAINPDSDAAIQSGLQSAVTNLLGSTSNLDLAWNSLDLARSLPYLPRGVNFTLDLLGFLHGVPRAVKALTKPGPRNSIELTRELAPTVTNFMLMLTNLPGLEVARPAAARFSSVIQISDQICVYQPPLRDGLGLASGRGQWGLRGQ